MTELPALTRRTFMYTSAMAAGAATLAGCRGGAAGQEDSGQEALSGKGSESRPLSPPSRFKESPELAKLVKSGELPPVEQRLPENPYVVPHKWQQSGKYGGRLLMNMADSEDGLFALKEYMYGRSLLRFLNDGLDIGPGLVESWESNDDASEWTFHFRKGLKWSDGKPWTTEDVMYWWDDMVQNPDHPELPPDDVRSGRDTTANVTAPDDLTLVLTFDAPAPITPERLAAWVNTATVGPWWHVPKHYLKRFHPRYDKSIKGGGWPEKHDSMADYTVNPDCPTMTGWKCRSYEEGRSVVFERNPYYWCVDKEGNQLPFIDEIQFSLVQDPEVQKLQFSEGRVDYVHGGHTVLTLADVSGLKRAASRTGVQVWFWDSGSGTGSITFFNYDHPDDGLRELFRDKKFRQALSHAFNRRDAKKSIYFNTGELTTGTLSPKGLPFHINDEAQTRYAEWRDSYVVYDPEKAKSLLDEVGVVDKDGDGVRERPDGSPLRISLDYPADSSDEHIKKNNLLKRDWGRIGIEAELNPVPPEAFTPKWQRGELTTTTAWEVGDNHPLVYPGWVIPVQADHWAPLHGQAFILQTGDPKAIEEQANVSPWKRQPPHVLAEEGDPIDRLWDLYRQARVEVDQMKRIRILWEVFKIHIDEGPYLMGVIANYPRIVLVREGLRNVPKKSNLALGGWVNPWILPSPAVYDPEAYFWDNPEEHMA